MREDKIEKESEGGEEKRQRRKIVCYRRKLFKRPVIIGSY